jgi:hypothetical protein
VLTGAVAALVVASGLAAAQVASAGKPQTLTTLSPLSAGVQVAQAVQAGTLTPSAAGALAAESPDASVLPNVKASQGSQPVNEDPITADPNNGQHLVTGGNDYNCSAIQGFHTSSDGGATFSHHCMGVLSGCSGFGDPTLAYDMTGNEYIFGIDGCGSSGWRVAFEKSTNNGGSFSSPAIAVVPVFTNGLTDKEWAEADHGSASPRPGALYVSTTQFTSNESQSVISVSHSYNGGSTWSTVQVDTASIYDQFSDLAVADDGTVYVTWMRCTPNGPTGDCGGTTATFFISKSTDGGKTWSAAKQITTAMLAPDSCGAYYGCVPGTNERLSNIPVIDVDHANGNLYVVYYHYTGTVTQARVIKSTDGGNTWGNPKKVFGSKHNQWLPWLSVGPSGQVGVSTLFSTTGTQFVAKAAFSTDGGATYTKKKTSTATSNTTSDGFGGGFIGDYTGNIWTGTTLHQSWPDTRTGTAADETGGLLTP